MIRAIITALFAEPTPRSWVPGLGLLDLPGVLEHRHAGLSNGRRRAASNGKPSDLSSGVSG